MAALLGSLAASGIAAAADPLLEAYAVPHAEWSLFSGLTRTDNATRGPGGPSDTIGTVGVGGGIYRDSGRLRLDADGSLRYEDYFGGTFSGHLLANLVGSASYAILPERLNWVLQDTYGQINTNPLLPTNPGTRLNVNTVSTGPDLALRLGNTTRLKLGARYGQSDFQSNPNAQIDDRRVTGTAGLIRELSSSSSLSLNASSSRVEYRTTGNPSFRQNELYARLESRAQRSGIALDGGVTEVTEHGSSVHDPLVRLTLFRRLTPSWSINLVGGSEFRNTGSAFQSALTGGRVVNGQTVPAVPGGGPLPGDGIVDVNLSQSIFRADYARAGFDFVRPRTRFGIDAGVGRERYQFGFAALDRNTASAGANFTRRLQPLLDLRLTADYERRSPQATLPGDRTKTAEIGLDWQSGAKLLVTLAYHFEDRSTEAAGFPYRENRVYLGVVYGTPKHSRAGQAGGLPGVTAPSR